MITKGMIEAGLKAIKYTKQSFVTDTMVKDIYEAMSDQRHKEAMEAFEASYNHSSR